MKSLWVIRLLVLVMIICPVFLVWQGCSLKIVEVCGTVIRKEKIIPATGFGAEYGYYLYIRSDTVNYKVRVAWDPGEMATVGEYTCIPTPAYDIQKLEK